MDLRWDRDRFLLKFCARTQGLKTRSKLETPLYCSVNSPRDDRRRPSTPPSNLASASRTRDRREDCIPGLRIGLATPHER
jgi:hypothetical protein